jgi:hypothetical protein
VVIIAEFMQNVDRVVLRYKFAEIKPQPTGTGQGAIGGGIGYNEPE